MSSIALTSHADVAEIVLYAFFLFFAGLVYYLRREDKREGYPLVPVRAAQGPVRGFPPAPPPKAYQRADGTTVFLPRVERDRPAPAAVPTSPFPGSPLEPTGDPMRDAVGPASYALRAEVPDHLFETGAPKIVPLRAAPSFSVSANDPDPRGMTVITADGRAAGTVVDAWVDRAECFIRYLEVEAGAKRVLVPSTLVRIDSRKRRVKVESVLAPQLAAAPTIAQPDTITLREEDRISAYFASGQLYATPDRLGPLL
jgi:photosynthetic reaction center H subunit